jgi:hypothetical protein
MRGKFVLIGLFTAALAALLMPEPRNTGYRDNSHTVLGPLDSYKEYREQWVFKPRGVVLR